MIRKWHNRDNHPSFYIPMKYADELDFSLGDSLDVEVDGMTVYLKKSEKMQLKVKELSNCQKYVSLPFLSDNKLLVKSTQVDIKRVDNTLIIKFL